MIVYNKSRVASEDSEFHGHVSNLPTIANNHAEHITALIDKVKYLEDKVGYLEKEVENMERIHAKTIHIIDVVYNFIASFYVGPERLKELKKQMEERKNEEATDQKFKKENDKTRFFRFYKKSKNKENS